MSQTGYPMQPRVVYDGRYIHDWLKGEGSGPGDAEFTRRAVTIKAGEGVLAHGTVLGQIAATKKFVAMRDGATDGSEVPAAILLYDVDATAGDVDVAALARRCVVVASELKWHASVDSPAKKAAALAVLAQREIVAVQGL